MHRKSEYPSWTIQVCGVPSTNLDEPDTAKAVASVLADRVRQLESQLGEVQRMAVGRHVLILRGNPSRGPESGAGFGRKVPAIIEDVSLGGQVQCRLLRDDPYAVWAPCLAGESGLWAQSQILTV